MGTDIHNAAENRVAGRIAVIAIAVVMLLTTFAYIWLHLTSPVDGARLETTRLIWRIDGVVITPMELAPDGLRPDDLVMAVGGRSVADWVRALFDPKFPQPDLHFGQVLEYDVQRAGQRLVVPVTYGKYPLGGLIASRWGVLLFAFASQIIGTFVFLRRPDDPPARLLFLWSWLGWNSCVWAMGLQFSDLLGRTGFWLYSFMIHGVWLLYWSVALHFSFVFPKKSFLAERYPGKIFLIYLAAFLFYFLYIGIAWFNAENILVWLSSWDQAGYLLAFVYQTLMVTTIIRNYRRDQDVGSRQKIRWVVFGAFVSGFGGLILWTIPPIILGRQIISANLLGILVTVFPVTIAIAILRHQLFDIDLIINRTLVYSLLTGILALIYFITVIVLQFALRTITGEESQITVAVSTLVIVLLFNPLRRGTQNSIDRRFYRRKYNAQQTLEAFASGMRNEVELDQIKSSLLVAVEKTLQPEKIVPWLRPSGQRLSAQIQKEMKE